MMAFLHAVSHIHWIFTGNRISMFYYKLMKIQMKLKERLGHDMGSQIIDALKDTQVKKTIEAMIKEDRIQLLDEETGK